LTAQVHTIPAAIDHEIAALKLSAMGVRLDKLTDEQEAYQNQWQEGT
jgi:adenosylhomocysteinase